MISSKEELENFLAGTSQIGGRGAQCADNKFTLDWMEGQEFNLLNTESCSPEKLAGLETMKAHYLLQCFEGDNVLNRKPDGSIVVTSQGKERMLVDNGNRIEESIFDEIFPGFDQFSGKLFTVCRICVILRIILFSRK